MFSCGIQPAVGKNTRIIAEDGKSDKIYKPQEEENP
jgi:hypothetical protein